MFDMYNEQPVLSGHLHFRYFVTTDIKPKINPTILLLLPSTQRFINGADIYSYDRQIR